MKTTTTSKKHFRGGKCLRRLVKAIIDNDEEFEDKRETTVEEYYILCDLNGVKADLGDFNFNVFLFGKANQDWFSNEDFRDAFEDYIKEEFDTKKIKGDFEDVLYEIVSHGPIKMNEYPMERDFYSLIADWCILHIPDSEAGKLAKRFAKAFGVSKLTFQDIYGHDLFDEVKELIGKSRKTKGTENYARNYNQIKLQ